MLNHFTKMMYKVEGDIIVVFIYYTHFPVKEIKPFSLELPINDRCEFMYVHSINIWDFNVLLKMIDLKKNTFKKGLSL